MDLMLLRVFQHQIAYQCQCLLWSAAEVDMSLRRNDIPRTFFALQNLLSAAANISKAAFRGGGKNASDRRELRASLHIADDSPLESKKMRNNFEHYDEKLDEWMAKSTRHSIHDLMIGPLANLRGTDAIDRFRHFDPATGEVTFWSDTFNVKRLIEEAYRILPIATRESRKPHIVFPAPPRSEP